MSEQAEWTSITVPKLQPGDWLIGPWGVREITEEDLGVGE